MARHCILVIEDDEPFRYYLTHTIRMHGYEVVEAADGRSGLDQWLAMEPKPALVLSSISLPGMNGMELAERLREYQHDAKILYINSGSKPEFELLRRPFHGDELMKAIERRLFPSRARSTQV